MYVDERFAGPAALLLSFCFVALAAAPNRSLNLEALTNRLEKYEKIEFRVGVAQIYSHPFDPDQVDLSIRFKTPGGNTLTVPAFWHQEYERKRLVSGDRTRDWFYPVGDASWQARFAPSETGPYEAVAVLKDNQGTAMSNPVRFQCVPSRQKGFVRTSLKDPRFFEFSERQPFFAIGQNLAFIGDQQYVSLSKAEEIFGKLSRNGGNYLRIWTCCEDWALAIEARKSAFGRSWDWHPQIVAVPDAVDSGRKCLRLAADKNTLRVDPSHPVGLRPNTRYVLSAQVRLELGAELNLELKGTKPLFAAASNATEWKQFKHEFQSGPDEWWLPPLSFHLAGGGNAWVADLSLKQADGGPELLWEADVNRPIRGYYNPLDCYMLDELASAAEKQGIYLQLCVLTRDLYMSALKNPDSAEYDQAIKDARTTFRYAVARWGHSTSVAAWEYWNEMDPGLPTDKFYAALGEYLEESDPYHHLRTTSTWGPSAKDCRHPKLDLADVHFYLRPSDKGRLEEEVDAVLERTRWLRQQAHSKPAHLGEFGLANEKWQPTEEMGRSQEVVDMHNALWASALSGASGTAMFWWWERLDQRDFYPHYRPLSQFIADVPWNGGDLRSITGQCSDARVRVIGLQAGRRAWLWLFNREAAWAKIVIEQKTPKPVAAANLALSGYQSGDYVVQWFDTREGKVLRRDTAKAKDGGIELSSPEFTHDLACLIGSASN